MKVGAAAVTGSFVLDSQFGPLVMVAAGGIWVEILEDRAFALPPIDTARAERLLEGLAISRLLAGVRGAEASDIGSITDALARLSMLALDMGDRLAALDVNPLIASANGCMAVDALVVPNAVKTHGRHGPGTNQG